MRRAAERMASRSAAYIGTSSAPALAISSLRGSIGTILAYLLAGANKQEVHIHGESSSPFDRGPALCRIHGLGRAGRREEQQERGRQGPGWNLSAGDQLRSLSHGRVHRQGATVRQRLGGTRLGTF